MELTIYLMVHLPQLVGPYAPTAECRIAARRDRSAVVWRRHRSFSRGQRQYVAVTVTSCSRSLVPSVEFLSSIGTLFVSLPRKVCS